MGKREDDLNDILRIITNEFCKRSTIACLSSAANRRPRNFRRILVQQHTLARVFHSFVTAILGQPKAPRAQAMDGFTRSMTRVQLFLQTDSQLVKAHHGLEEIRLGVYLNIPDL